MLFSEPKIPQSGCGDPGAGRYWVSVLFSEPKIPQSDRVWTSARASRCFSALQRAENSSICPRPTATPALSPSFSALQRAENSSISLKSTETAALVQCFSALQRAENSSIFSLTFTTFVALCFSALQRAENSSTGVDTRIPGTLDRFQCSSASRKFLNSLR